jgi:hypothetical protein
MSCDQPEINKADAAALASMTTKECGGNAPKGSIAARLQSLADRNAFPQTPTKEATDIDKMTMKDGMDLIHEVMDRNPEK